METKNDSRSGEKKESLYRSGRFYSVSNEWYFSVRETDDQGPYLNKLTAEKGLKDYLLDYEHFSVEKNKLNINNLKLI